MKHSVIDDASITDLVYRFYEHVRADPELGPIFDHVIGERWETHMPTMVKFWSSVMLKSATYNGTPMPKHMALKNVTPEHFKLWLRLFRETTAELFEPELAQQFVIRAERIAESFQLGMFYRPGNLKIVNAPI